MEKIIEWVVMVFVMIGAWFGSRLTKQIDELSKDKADNSQTREVEKYHAKLIHELDRRIDTVKHTLVAREEYKSDISSLHTRINIISEKKADKILNIRTHQAKERNGET